MPFVQALGQRQRHFGGEAKAAVGLALQAGEVVQQATRLGGGLGFFFYRGGLVVHRLHHALGSGFAPQALGFDFGVGAGFNVFGGGFFDCWVKPFARVLARLRAKGGVHFPVVAALEGADFFFALHHHGQRGRLHTAHGGQEEAAIAAVESRHGAGAVDAHQPVGFGAAAGGIGQGAHLFVAAQLVKAIANGLRRHGLQPQAPHGLVQRLARATGVLLNQTEDELALAPRVAGVDELAHVFALGLLDHGRQARLGFVDGLEVEVRRNHGQVRKAPLATLDVVRLGRRNLDQMAHG